MNKYILILILFLLVSCKTEKTPKRYLRHVGDIEYNKDLDNANFTICNGISRVVQYFNLGKGIQYKGERRAITNHFYKNYKSVTTNDTGLIRIRFIVNCKGEIGRFRIMSMNKEYQEIEFNEDVSSQLLSLTKKLNGWEILTYKNKPLDYYQYLIFKIEKGNLIDILP